jgi:hypothetical protein
MFALSLGSHGDEVRRVEQRLSSLGLYTGSIDGEFGGGVQSAVKAFQRTRNLEPDGVVGSDTWSALFPGSSAPTAPSLVSQPMAQRCLALTGTFETSTGAPECFCGLAGNFDGQGISFGVLQWNLGQGTLQPMLRDMIAMYHDVAFAIFADALDTLVKVLASPRAQQLEWADSIQDPQRHIVFEPWKGLLRALGRTAEFQTIQAKYAESIRTKAESMCDSFGVWTERGLALMFDICVQNGSIGRDTASKIRADFGAIAIRDPASAEIARLRVIANRRAEAAASAFVEDVRRRKLTIANGEGTVHNIPYNLEQQFGIRLVPFAS